MPGKRLTLGIFGFGCVGSGLYETLREAKFSQAHIKRICVKDPNKARTAPYALFTTNQDVLLNDPDIDVIVELIDDANAAYEIVTRALKAGKHVVSANKKLIAEHLNELIELQESTGKSLLYEGACAASIPIIRNLEEYYDNDLLAEVSGILNGSTNFILSAIEEGGTYEAALELAQELGFAETDPSLDVDGWDAKFKTTLLLAHGFGHVVDPSRIHHLGIRGITPEIQRVAAERQQRIKLISKCWRVGDKVHAAVLPTFVDRDEELAHVEREVNGVTVVGAFSERQFFRGKGAGSLPTAAAVLSDISALTYDYRYEYKKKNRDSGSKYVPDFKLWAHVSGKDPLQIPTYAFDSISRVHRSPGHTYVEGKIGIAELITLASDGLWSVAALSSSATVQLEKEKHLSVSL